MDAPDRTDADVDVDLILRNLSGHFPEDFARAILPHAKRVTSATWMDTQVAARQRRLDRVLDVVADGERRLEHTEWQLEWSADLPWRMFEYHVLLALHPDTATATPPPRIRSTVVLLSGRDTPWPAHAEYRTSPDDARFSGVTFEIDAVYQRTVAELEARASPFWLVFAPLAVDADAAAMRRVLSTLRERAKGRKFDELAVTMLDMAGADKRRRGLSKAIVPLLSKETVMRSWVFSQGEAYGEAKGEAKALLLVLKSRGLPVSEKDRERILGCTDTAQLEAWLDRALVARTIDEVMAGHGRTPAPSRARAPKAPARARAPKAPARSPRKLA